jgi:hypothetical protein
MTLTVVNKIRQKITIPSWLEGSELYCKLNKDSILQSSTPLKVNSNVTSMKDLKLILSVIKFWGVKEIPTSIFIFITFYTQDEERKEEMKKLLQEDVNKEISSLLIPFIGAERDKWCLLAVEIGNLNLLKEFRGRYAPWNEEVTEKAAEMKRADIFIYCVENKCRFTKKAMDKACESGDLTILSYIVEIFLKQGTYYTNYEHYRTAVKLNYLDILQFLIEKDINETWKENSLILLSIENDSWECFKYLCDNGSNISPSDFFLSVKIKKEIYIDYLMLTLYNRGEDLDNVKNNVEIMLCAKDDINMVKFLVNRGFKWNLCVFVTHSLPVITFFHEQYKNNNETEENIWTEDFFEWAFECGYMDIVDYLIKNNCPKNIKKIIKNCVMRDDFSQIAYLSQFL